MTLSDPDTGTTQDEVAQDGALLANDAYDDSGDTLGTPITTATGETVGDTSTVGTQTVPRGVSAFIGSNAGIDAGRNVDLDARERIKMTMVTGSVGAGAVGAGASITILVLDDPVQAFIGEDAAVEAGSDVTLDATLTEDVYGMAVAGQFSAFTSIGAQVVVLVDKSDQYAFIDTGASVEAGGDVKLHAAANRIQFKADVIGGSVSGLGAAVGASVAIATIEGETKAYSKGDIGSDTPVDSLEIDADSTADMYAQSITANIGAGAVGVTVAKTTFKPTVEAAIMAGTVDASGEVSLDANTTSDMEAHAPGGSGGGVAVAAMIAQAFMQGSALAYVGSATTIKAGTLNVKASETSTVKADIKVYSVGLGAGGGGKAEAKKTTTVKAYIGPNAIVEEGTGDVTVEATSTDTVTSDARGGTGGVIAIGYMQSFATIGGQTQAYIDQGTTIDADSLTVKATAAKRDLTATSLVVSVSLGGGGGANTETKVLSTTDDPTNYASVDAYIGPKEGATYSNSPVSLDIDGAILVQATTVANATTDATVGAGGGLTVAALYGYATVGGDVRAYLGQYVEVTDATSLTIKAEATNRASVETEVVSGAVAAGFGTSARGTVNDNIYAYIAPYTDINVTSDLSTEGNIVVEAWSKRAEAKATANSYGGGGIAVGAAYANATSTPSVFAYIGSGATINASGDVSVTAKADSVPATVPLDDKIVSIDTTTDQITFTSHGLLTSDTVTYVVGTGTLCLQGVTCSGTTGYVTSDRIFPVVTVDEDKIVFGVLFSGTSIDAGNPLTRPNGVDSTHDVIHFSTQHNLHNGDPVLYSTVNGTAISGINTTTTYFVHVVDEFSIRLFTSRDAAMVAAKNFTVANVNGSTININNHGYTEGQAVIYNSPEAEGFTTEQVGWYYNADGTKTDVADNRIFLGEDTNGDGSPDSGHGLSTGQKITFKTDGGAITNLYNNVDYYVYKIDNYQVALAASYCEAVGYSGDNSCTTPDGDDEGTDPDPILQNLITLNMVSGQQAKRNLLVPSALDSLQDGHTYYVHVVDTNNVELALTYCEAVGYSGNSGCTTADGPDEGTDPDPIARQPIILTEIYVAGTHKLSPAGVNLTASGSGTHQLRINISSWQTGNKLYAYKAVLEDGSTEYVSLRSLVPPPGDGVTNATAKGGQGGIVSVTVPTAVTNVTHTAKAYIASSVTAGGDVTISSISNVRTKAYVKNSSGGVIMVGEADATTNVTNYTKSFFGLDTTSITNNDHTATGLQIRAGGTFTVSSEFRLEIDDVDCITHGGGFLAFADADANANITNHTVSVIGSGADIEADAVKLSAKVSKLNADAYAESRAGGFTGTSRADAYVNIDQTSNWKVLAWIRGGTSTNKTLIKATHGMDVISELSNFTLDGHKSAKFYGLSAGSGGSGEPEKNTMKSTVDADGNTTITPGPRNNASTSLTVVSTLPTLVLFVQGVNTTWDADVIVLSGPEPSLWVDANGVIQTKTDNVTITQGGVTKNVGDTITGAFVVGDIVNKYHGQIRFQSNNASGSSSSVGTIQSSSSGDYAPMFEFRDTFNGVSLINDSPRTT